MERGSGTEGPGIRLMRIWLWLAPLGMLALAAVFAVLAVGDERWALLAVMAVLALVSVALFVLQWRLLRRLGR